MSLEEARYRVAELTTKMNDRDVQLETKTTELTVEKESNKKLSDKVAQLQAELKVSAFLFFFFCCFFSSAVE
jgi:hypothetical protein